MPSHDTNKVTTLFGDRKYCAFRIADHLFGVDVLDVREIKIRGDITPIPHSSSAILGYLNLRSQINLVIGLRRLCRIDDGEADDRMRIIYFKHVIGEPFGILVDKIEDICEVAAEDVESFDGHLSHDEKKEGLGQSLEQGVVSGLRNTIDFSIISGICRLPKELMLILDSRKILDASSKLVA